MPVQTLQPAAAQVVKATLWVFKWALDQFFDQEENSRVFALAFMSFVGAWQEHQRITDNNKLKIRSRGEDVKRS